MAKTRLHELVHLIEQRNGYVRMFPEHKQTILSGAIEKLVASLELHFLSIEQEDPITFTEMKRWKEDMLYNDKRDIFVGRVSGGEAVPSAYVVISGSHKSYDPCVLSVKTEKSTKTTRVAFTKFYLQPDETFGTMTIDNRIRRFGRDLYSTLKPVNIEEAVIQLWINVVVDEVDDKELDDNEL